MEPGAGHWLVAVVAAGALHLFLLTLVGRPAEPVSAAQPILIELGEGAEAEAGASGAETLSPLGAEVLAEAEPVALQAGASEVVSEDMAAPDEAIPATDLNRPVAERSKRRKKPLPSTSKKSAAKTRRNKKALAAGPRGVAGGKETVEKASGRQGGGKGSGAAAVAAKSRYASEILAWLHRNKRYPSQARRSGQQGSVTVRFTLDRMGRVLSSSVVRSSGHSILDGEARALLRRGRMPPMPAAMQQSRLTITVPIRFQLQ
jgi:protein TonB